MEDMQAYDFDSPIHAPKKMTTFPEGIAGFVVVEFARVRKPVKFRGSFLNNGQPIAVASIKLKCQNDAGDTAILEEELPLHETYSFKLWPFFSAIGQRNHGDPAKQFMPDWNKVEGAKGFLLVKHVKGKTAREDGEFPTFVNISEFYTADEVEAYYTRMEKKEAKAAEKKTYF